MSYYQLFKVHSAGDAAGDNDAEQKGGDVTVHTPPASQRHTHTHTHTHTRTHTHTHTHTSLYGQEGALIRDGMGGD